MDASSYFSEYPRRGYFAKVSKQVLGYLVCFRVDFNIFHKYRFTDHLETVVLYEVVCWWINVFPLIKSNSHQSKGTFHLSELMKLNRLINYECLKRLTEICCGKIRMPKGENS